MRRFISYFMVFLLVFTGIGPVYAQNLRQVIVSEDNIENVAKYAVSFAETFNNKKFFSSGHVITMLDAENQIAGFCVDILQDGRACGYVVIKFSRNQPIISEFCFEAEAKNPFDAKIDYYRIGSDNLIFYSIGANEYQVYDRSIKIAYGDFNEVMTDKEFDAFKTESLTYRSERELLDGALDSHRLSGETVGFTSLDGWSVVSDSYTGTVKSSKTIVGAITRANYCSNTVRSNGLTYACSVVALSNLMKYLRSRGFTKISGDFKTLYNELWKYAETSSTGGTSNGNEPKAAKKYLQNKGYSCNYYTISSGKNMYSSFKSALDLNKPCIFTYGASFGGSKGGHAVFVAGYCETSTYQYLRIADGWNPQLRYINFNGYNYSRMSGWSITANK